MPPGITGASHHTCLPVGTGHQDLVLPLVQPLLYLQIVHFFLAPFQSQPFTYKTKGTLELWLSCQVPSVDLVWTSVSLSVRGRIRGYMSCRAFGACCP